MLQFLYTVLTSQRKTDAAEGAAVRVNRGFIEGEGVSYMSRHS